MEWHSLIEGVVAATILGIGKMLFDMRNTLTSVATVISEVKTTELPDIKQDISDTREQLYDVRDTLIQHISKGH